MIGEHLSRAGAPAVGFGDADISIANPIVLDPLVGLVTGTIAGSLIGNAVKKGIGAAVGSILGGLGGTVVGAAVAVRNKHVASANTPPPTPVTPTPPAWHRLQASTAAPKAGQQLALAIEGPNHTALTSDQVAQFTATLPAQIAAYGATQLIGQYPPGTPLPADWPADDDLGPGAYRALVNVLIDATPTFTQLLAPSSVATLEGWVRDKS